MSNLCWLYGDFILIVIEVDGVAIIVARFIPPPIQILCCIDPYILELCAIQESNVANLGILKRSHYRK